MDRDFIIWLMGAARKFGVSELEYSDGESRIRIVCDEAGSRKDPASQTISPGAGTSPTEAPKAPDNIRHAVRAGVSGLFYRAPSPGADPFVKVGDVVEEGTTLGVLEAMKMLTPIEADASGRIVEIAVDDGATINAGTVIFLLEQTA